MSFDSFFFVITHCDEMNNFNLEQKKKEINNIIFSGELYGSTRFNQTKFLIAKFSNIWYQKYLEKQKYVSNIKDLYSYLEKQIKNIKIEDKNYIKSIKKNLKNNILII